MSFDPVTLEELPSYDGPVSLDYYGRLHPCHVVGTVRLAAHTSSAKEIRTALLFAFDKKIDHRLYIRRLGVVAGNLQSGYVQLDFFTDYAAQEKEKRLQKCFNASVSMDCDVFMRYNYINVVLALM